ncbi:PP2C family protein-serine/threonine phosphatase [Actinomycetospora atypica]|uniref:PP2C family protein-serine/threonine phosphatase n=1 Tax=Actinomycetospora atypica TaxID=1290095 RepID=A0ABV9YNP1_9PSEU
MTTPTMSGGAACLTCGELGEPGDRFCEGCGTALPETVGPEVAASTSRPVTARAGSATGEHAPDEDGPAEPAPGEHGPGDGHDGHDGHDAPGDPGQTTGRPCTACGEGTIADDGFCDDCGRPDGGVTPGTVPPDQREHAAHAVPGAAAVTDRGRVRAANEDAYGLVRLPLAGDAGDVTVAVVCDGVASVPGSAAASATACETVLEAARDAIAHPDAGDPELEATGGLDLGELAHVCADAAIEAVTTLGEPRNSPACTYVSAIVAGEVLVISWIGDSRAYWLVPDEPEASAVLTTDDSWAAEAVAIGLLSPEAAYADPRAHAITRWVAADGPPGPAHVVAHAADRAGVVLICSDGLWNHIPLPADLADLVSDDPASTADAMLAAAMDDGGTDNTTLVVIDVGHWEAL